MAVIQQFTDIKTAFQYKTDESLRKSVLLFSTLNYKVIVKIGTSLVKFALFLRLPVKFIIKKTVFHQFCGGETIQECRNTIAKIGHYGVSSILDYAMEGEDSEKGYDEAKDEILKTIQEAARNENIPFSVFKVTGIAGFSILEKVSAGKTLNGKEEAEWKRVRDRVDELCETAAKLGVPIMIDSEESWIQEAIDQMVYANMKKYNDDRAMVYNTFQMYRVDMLDRLRKAFHYAATHNYYLGAKLVRGAYMEKERDRAQDRGYRDPICPTKEATDENYNKALKFCIDNMQRVYMVSGSHNEYSNYYLTLLMEKYNMKPSDQRVYFAQLFGMSDHISFVLAKEGFNSVKYVPYGPVNKVMPYLFRRAEENTAIAGQSGRELQLVKAELKRRKREK